MPVPSVLVLSFTIRGQTVHSPSRIPGQSIEYITLGGKHILRPHPLLSRSQRHTTRQLPLLRRPPPRTPSIAFETGLSVPSTLTLRCLSSSPPPSSGWSFPLAPRIAVPWPSPPVRDVWRPSDAGNRDGLQYLAEVYLTKRDSHPPSFSSSSRQRSLHTTGHFCGPNRFEGISLSLFPHRPSTAPDAYCPHPRPKEFRTPALRRLHVSSPDADVFRQSVPSGDVRYPRGSSCHRTVDDAVSDSFLPSFVPSKLPPSSPPTTLLY